MESDRQARSVAIALPLGPCTDQLGVADVGQVVAGKRSTEHLAENIRFTFLCAL